MPSILDAQEARDHHPPLTSMNSWTAKPPLTVVSVLRPVGVLVACLTSLRR
jgi:hypothetical protein